MVTQHDGSILSLHKLAELYDPSDRAQALGFLQSRQAQGEIVTGLLFVDPEAGDLHDALDTVSTPLNELGHDDLVPGAAALAKINADLR
jgi:2-oxoglutarate ferredoxin oxidoreductase subunit beta